MRIFTNRGFEEEISRRINAKEEFEWNRRQFVELHERIDRLQAVVEELRCKHLSRQYAADAERKEE